MEKPFQMHFISLENDSDKSMAIPFPYDKHIVHVDNGTFSNIKATFNSLKEILFSIKKTLLLAHGGSDQF